MNKLILSLIFLTLFTIPVGFSIDFNYIYNITSPSATPTWNRIKAYHYNETRWFVTHQSGASSSCNRIFYNLDQSFTNLGSSCISSFSSWEFQNSACSVTNDYTDNERFSCFGSSLAHSGFRYGSFQDYIMSNMTAISRGTCVDSSQYFGSVLSATDDVSDLFSWRRTTESGNDPRYTSTYSCTDYAGDGFVDFPTEFQDFSDIDVVMCNYELHFIIKESGGIRDLIYDYGLNYHGFENLQPTAFSPNTYDYSVYVDEDTWTMYLGIFNRTTGKINLQAWECDGNYNLNHIFTENKDMIEIEPTWNYTGNKEMRFPYFMKSRDNLFHLFYEWHDGSDYNIKVAVESGICINGSWTQTDICVDGYRKYTRFVIPDGCTNNTKWEYDESCYGEFCTPSWVCYDSDTKAYQNLDCSLTSYTDCTGGTPYCINGDCVAGCTRGYLCTDSVTRAFVDEACQQSEIINCNSTGSGYCYDGRCYEILTPAFDEDASVLDILESTTAGVKGMLRWISPPMFKILMAIAITLLILGIFGLVLAVGKKATSRGR